MVRDLNLVTYGYGQFISCNMILNIIFQKTSTIGKQKTKTLSRNEISGPT